MKTFTMTLAMNVCTYATREIEAETMEDAIEAIRAEAEKQGALEYDGLWSGSFDPEWDTATEHRIVDITDDETKETMDDIMLSDEDAYGTIITADQLAAQIAAAQGDCIPT